MRPTSAAAEPRGNRGPRKGVFQQSQVLPGRPQQHRHLVEPDAPARLIECIARNFHRLTAFAWCRVQSHLPAWFTQSWCLRGEEVPSQPAEIVIGGFGRLGNHRTTVFECGARSFVVRWRNGDPL